LHLAARKRETICPRFWARPVLTGDRHTAPVLYAVMQQIPQNDRPRLLRSTWPKNFAENFE